MCPAMHYCDVKTHPRWRTAAILKIPESPYLGEKSSDFDKIWYTTADVEPHDSHVTKSLKFKIQDGGGRHLKNRFFGHITDSPISVKFCMRKQNGMSTRAAWQKLQIFKIQDGGRPPFWKSLNRHISVKNRPILMKFGTQRQILNPVTVTWQKIEIWISFFFAITHRPIVRFQRNFVWGSFFSYFSAVRYSITCLVQSEWLSSFYWILTNLKLCTSGPVTSAHLRDSRDCHRCW